VQILPPTSSDRLGRAEVGPRRCAAQRRAGGVARRRDTTATELDAARLCRIDISVPADIALRGNEPGPAIVATTLQASSRRDGKAALDRLHDGDVPLTTAVFGSLQHASRQYIRARETKLCASRLRLDNE
jgi:hypothetical protein